MHTIYVWGYHSIIFRNPSPPLAIQRERGTRRCFIRYCKVCLRSFHCSCECLQRLCWYWVGWLLATDWLCPKHQMSKINWMQWSLDKGLLVPYLFCWACGIFFGWVRSLRSSKLVFSEVWCKSYLPWVSSSWGLPFDMASSPNTSPVKHKWTQLKSLVCTIHSS